MRLLPPLHGIGTTPGIYKTQGFGEHPEVYSQFGLKGHNGLDIGAPKGTPILAVNDGRIEQGSDPKGYGNFIRLYFDEYDCIYGHLERFEGSPRNVKASEIIGYVNSTGFSTGNHLHFGIRRLLNGQVVDYTNGYFGYIDPEPFFKMNQAKVVKSKVDGSVYVAYEMPDLDYLKKKANLEGFDIPNPIPDTDSLK